MEEFIKEEKERQARTWMESGGPPKPKGRKSPQLNGGKYSQVVELVYGDLNPAPPPLPDGIDSNSVFREHFGKLGIATISSSNVSTKCDSQRRHLSVKDVSRLYSAIAYANRKGMVFNAHITISWSLLGIGKANHGEAATGLKEFCKGLLTWGRSHGLSPDRGNIAYVYVHEVGPKLGLHTHLLVSVPSSLCKKLIAWAPKRVRGISKVDAIPKEAVEVISPERRIPYVKAQWRWFHYLCKGIDPLAIVKTQSKQRLPASWLIEHDLRSPGEVGCRKRVGVSSNIAESSQKRDGFRSAWQQAELDVRILYRGDEYWQWQREQEEQEIKGRRSGYVIESLEGIW